MGSQGRAGQTDEQVIYFSDLLAAILERKVILLAFIAVTTLIGLLYAVFTMPLYTATVTLQPVSEEDAQLGGVAQRFSGAAALAGINLGSGNNNREEYIAILKSRELAERFIERHAIKPHLFPERWNAAQEKWRGDGKPDGFRVALSRLLARLSGDEGWQPPTGPEPGMWEAYKTFSELLRIGEDRETRLVTLEIEFRNPELAAQWANDYVSMANAEIRQRAIAEATRALAFLDQEAQKTTIAGVRDTVFGLMEGQLEKIMLANARSEFAFKVLDRAVPPEERSHPRRGLIVVLSMIFGGMLGLFAAFVLAFWKNEISAAGAWSAKNAEGGVSL